MDLAVPPNLVSQSFDPQSLSKKFGSPDPPTHISFLTSQLPDGSRLELGALHKIRVGGRVLNSAAMENDGDVTSCLGLDGQLPFFTLI